MFYWILVVFWTVITLAFHLPLPLVGVFIFLAVVRQIRREDRRTGTTENAAEQAAPTGEQGSAPVPRRLNEQLLIAELEPHEALLVSSYVYLVPRGTPMGRKTNGPMGMLGVTSERLLFVPLYLNQADVWALPLMDIENVIPISGIWSGFSVGSGDMHREFAFHSKALRNKLIASLREVMGPVRPAQLHQRGSEAGEMIVALRHELLEGRINEAEYRRRMEELL